MTSSIHRAAGKRSPRSERLARLLSLAAHLIAQEGYQKASIRKVARAANVSIPSLYHYFKEKEEMLFLIQYHTFDSLVRQLKERLPPATSPEQKLYRMIENHLEHFLTSMDELKVCAKELQSLSGRYYGKVLQKRQEYYQLTVEIVEELKEKFRNTKVDSRLATLFLFGMLNWIHMWYRPGDGDSLKKITEQMHNLFLFGLGEIPMSRRAGRRKENRDV